MSKARGQSAARRQRRRYAQGKDQRPFIYYVGGKENTKKNKS